MEARLNHAATLLLYVSRHTRLWAVGVIFSAILLSVSFFTEPTNRELLIQSKSVNTEEKATAPQMQDKRDVNLILEGSAASAEHTEVNYIKNGTNIQIDEDVPISLEDFDALCKIVHAEAGCEDLEGRILIANVVMNRVKSDIFPDDVKDVILQVGQFEPVTRGSYDHSTPDNLTKEAVIKALNGEDLSGGALYFQKSESKVWDTHEYLFRHGSHSFYR